MKLEELLRQRPRSISFAHSFTAVSVDECRERSVVTSLPPRLMPD